MTTIKNHTQKLKEMQEIEEIEKMVKRDQAENRIRNAIRAHCDDAKTKIINDIMTHTSLTAEQAKEVLDAIDSGMIHKVQSEYCTNSDIRSITFKNKTHDDER